MRIRIASSANGRPSSSYQYLTTIIVNETVAVDAGSLGFLADIDLQRRIEHVLLSHSHLDHLASLPMFLENVYTPDDRCVTVHASDHVRETLRSHVFNDALWPDFIRLSREIDPFLALQPLEARKTVDLGDLRVTPIPVDHIVPTFGFILDDGAASVVIATDTAPTREIWEVAATRKNLRAVFLGCAFPAACSALANAAKHLTPPLFAAETAKVAGDVPFYVVHVKGFCHRQVLAEIQALGIPRIKTIESGREYAI